jgi:hypothetical protein
MTSNRKDGVRVTSVFSSDGTPIGCSSFGEGPGLIIVGGVLSSGSDYLPLARLLAQDFEVHVMDRRGRTNSGPQRHDQVKQNGFAPRPLAIMPLSCVRAVLRLGIRSRQWTSMDGLLEANLVEHRVQTALDAPSAGRFSTITARTLLMAGTKSPTIISQQLATELAEVIPGATVAILPGLDHPAPQHEPGQIVATILASRVAN